MRWEARGEKREAGGGEKVTGNFIHEPNERG